MLGSSPSTWGSVPICGKWFHHWPPKSNSLGVLSPYARSPGFYTILTLNKENCGRQSRLQNKNMIMDKEGNCIGIKGLDFPEDTTSLSVFVLFKVVQVRISLIAEIRRLLLLLKLIGKRCKQAGCLKVCLGMSESHIWARLY